MEVRKVSPARLNDSKGEPEQKERTVIFITTTSCCPAPWHTLLLSAISSQTNFWCLARKRAVEERGVCRRRGCWWDRLQGTETISLAYIGCALQDWLQFSLTRKQMRWHKRLQAERRFEGLHMQRETSDPPAVPSTAASRKWGEVEQQVNCCWGWGTLSSGRLSTRQGAGQGFFIRSQSHWGSTSVWSGLQGQHCGCISWENQVQPTGRIQS